MVSAVFSMFTPAAMVRSCWISRAMPLDRLDGKVVATLVKTLEAGMFSCSRRSCWSRLMVDRFMMGGTMLHAFAQRIVTHVSELLREHSMAAMAVGLLPR